MFIGELHSKQNILLRMNILFGQKMFYVDSMLIMIMREDSLDCVLGDPGHIIKKIARSRSVLQLVVRS